MSRHICRGCAGRELADARCAECGSSRDVAMVPEAGLHLCDRHGGEARLAFAEAERAALRCDPATYRRYLTRGSP